MRYLIALVLCALLVPTHVHACLGASMEYSLFFETIPNLQPDADVIAKVTLLDVSVLDFYKGTATAKVLQVLKTPDERVHQGSILSMKFMVSSCGPNHSNGNEGTIIAKAGADSEGRLVLYPYMRRYSDGRITPPSMLPDGFVMDPRPLRIEDGLPKNSAVILIGVSGAESVDYLGLSHSAFPRMNTTFPAHSNTIVAIAIPVGIKRLSIYSVTIGRRRAGYQPNDTVEVHAPELDINRPGLYYVATLDTNHPGHFQTAPLPEQLKKFRAEYGSTVERLDPINFKWPNQ
ncbi:MAG: hypothetical protein HY082_11300 [Gammaproteobacteria bacterium]|nr:hypothetical protein [Gammaproteobacteria bacterium]